ncbi:MAG: Lon protease [Microgenomates bacterium OLB22]|nr:MAG: Lon protease [Microgenomates bacterium OLB22]
MNEDFSLIEKSAIPVVPIRDGIVFPQVENALVFGRPKSVAAIHDGFSKDKQIILLLQKSPEKDDPTPEDLYSIGIRATIRKVFAGDNGEVTALIQGQERVRVTELLSIEPYMTAHVQVLPSLDEDDAETEALVRHISNELKHAVNLGKTVDVVYLMNIMGNASPAAFSDFVAMVLDLKVEERQILIEELDTKRRLQLEAEYVTKELKVLELERKIHNKTQKKFEKGMKDAVLREKLKTIEQELGGMPDGLGEDKDMDELKKKILRAKMPPEAHEKAIKELARLAKMAPFNPEVSYVRTYLELMVELPWNKMSKGVLDINKAQKVLDADHYGLKKVKERILEFLAVMKLKEMQAKSKKNSKDVKQPTILCFYGPPGVGKTSIGKSIAKALGREFVKMSLGGVRDEAEIRGHRRTYVGALPGRIIQAIKQAKTKNPVFMLDEIDKVGADYRGDPSSALLEALDPEQNHGFADHYLEVPFDLSNVMFITTANMLDTILRPSEIG